MTRPSCGGKLKTAMLREENGKAISRLSCCSIHIVVGTWTCPDLDRGPGPGSRTFRKFWQVPDLQTIFQLCCRTCDWLLTGDTNPLLGTPSQAYGTVSNPEVFLDLISHLSVHRSGCRAPQPSLKAGFQGGYVTTSRTCKRCPRHLLREGRSGRSDRGPGPGPGPGPVRRLKSAGPDYYEYTLPP